MQYLDLHCHVLPGVDDGPADLDETIELLRAAWDDGAAAVVATPHMFMYMFDNRDPREIRGRYFDLLDDLDVKSRESRNAFLRLLDIHLGAENFFCTEFLRALERGQVLSLRGSRNLLVEFSPLNSVDQIASGLEAVRTAGYMPILAHAERYPGIQRRPELLRDLRQAGCIVQMNAASVLGALPSGLRQAARKMVRDGLADVLASDAHDADTRAPCLTAAARWVTRAVSEEKARALLWETPALLLESSG